jgi:putative transposase
VDLWAYHAGVQINFSRPGKQTDNAYVESFNGTLRSECLDALWFTTLAEAKQIVEAWHREYNESRPHRALGERTPNEIACEVAASREFTSIKTAEDSLSG